MYQKTITKFWLKKLDILFYRPTNFFGILIGIFTAIMNGKFDRITFTHTAGVLVDPRDWIIKRFDAMEGKKTGFRKHIGNAYVFRFKNLTLDQEMKIESYLLSRSWSRYDRRWIIWFIISWVYQDEFKDYCSELYKNAFVFAGIIEDTERMKPHDLHKIIRDKVDFIWLIL